tara:strand:+ start:206 stop:991 length:786 start_codon:yes stop_codon:yes gene_type:complete
MAAILDIGSNDGSNGLAFAILNPHIKVYSFEPNPYLKKIVLGNKRKIEKKFKIYLKNFFFFEEAVSNKNEKRLFYITKNDATSSLLKPRKKLDKYWTSNKDDSIKNIADWVKIKKKIKIKTIKLSDFCKEKKINKICYIHCDTQGNDLRVFEGLGFYRNLVQKGVLESIVNPKLSLYNNSANLKKIKKKFKKWGYKIDIIHEFHKKNPERNIYFTNSKILKKDNFIFPTEKNLRLLSRVLRGKTRIKDLIDIFFIGKKFNN